jgi:hypothetical protein
MTLITTEPTRVRGWWCWVGVQAPAGSSSGCAMPIPFTRRMHAHTRSPWGGRGTGGRGSGVVRGGGDGGGTHPHSPAALCCTHGCTCGELHGEPELLRPRIHPVWLPLLAPSPTTVPTDAPTLGASDAPTAAPTAAPTPVFVNRTQRTFLWPLARSWYRT